MTLVAARDEEALIIAQLGVETQLTRPDSALRVVREKQRPSMLEEVLSLDWWYQDEPGAWRW